MNQSHDNNNNNSYQRITIMNNNFASNVNDGANTENESSKSLLSVNNPDVNNVNSEVATSTANNTSVESVPTKIQVSFNPAFASNVSKSPLTYRIHPHLHQQSYQNPPPPLDGPSIPPTVLSNQHNNSNNNSSILTMTINNSIKNGANKVKLKIKTPHVNDVLFGRGGGINSHPGNKSFRQIVKGEKERYNLACTKAEKAKISHQIVNLIHSKGGRFLSINPGKGINPGNDIYWMEVDANKAMAKTSQALREGAPEIRALHHQQQQQQKRQRQIPKKIDDKSNQEEYTHNPKSITDKTILQKRQEINNYQEGKQELKHGLEEEERIQNMSKKPKLIKEEEENVIHPPNGLAISASSNGHRGKCIVKTENIASPKNTNVPTENHITKLTSNQSSDNNNQSLVNKIKSESPIVFPRPLPVVHGMKIPNNIQDYQSNESKMTPNLIMADDDIMMNPNPTDTKSSSLTTTRNLSSNNQDPLMSLNSMPRIPSFTTNNLVTTSSISNTHNKPFFRSHSLAFSELSYELFNTQEEFSNPFAEEEDLLRFQNEFNNDSGLYNDNIINSTLSNSGKNNRSVINHPC